MYLVLVFTAASALAQMTDGSISGTIRDSSGAIVPEAKVESVNRNTGVVTAVRSNRQGLFSFAALNPGQYRLSVEMIGFKKSTLERIQLDVGAKLTLDVTLEVATAAGSVEVVAEARTDLAYATSSVGGVVESKRVLELPITSRNALTLATTQAGTFGSYFSGARIGTLNIQVDGVNTQDARLNQGRSNPFFLSVDRIAEFRVVTSPADAELGRGSGQIQMITRSGTNEYHGSLFEYHRNTVLNANTFFNNLQGSNADGTAIAPRNILVRNQFGARLGGPVELPKLYNGRNRTFFHVLFEGERIRQRSRVTRTVFTEQARQGIFRFFPGVQNGNASALRPVVDFSGNPVAPAGATGALQTVNLFQFDPNRTRPDASGLVRSALDLMPLPNVFNAGDGLNTAGFTWIQPSGSDTNQISLKLDHNFSERQRFTFSWNRETSQSPNGFQSQRFPNTPGGAVDSPDSAYAFKLFSVVRANLTNEMTVGVLRSRSRSLAPWEVEGGAAALPRINNQPFLLDFVSITDPILTDNDPQGRLSPNYQYSNNLSWIRGKHNFKAGAAVWFTSTNGFNSFDVMPRVNIGQGILPVANFQNIPGLGANRTAAENMLNDLSGSVASLIQAFNAPGGANPQYLAGEFKARVWRSREHYFFFKDDWRVSRRLTLNIGLRYEFYQVPHDKSGKTAATVGRQAGLFGISGRDETAMFRPGATGGSLSRVELIGPKTANPDGLLFRPDRNNFAPAVGLSWSLPWFGENKTIFRAGYSMGYERNSLRIIDVFSGDQPGLRNRVLQPVATFTTLAGVRLPLVPTAAPLEVVPLSDRQQTLRAFDENLRQPYVQNWNASLQRQLPGGLLLDIRYVGNKGTRGIRATNLNETNILENGILDAFRLAQAGQESPLLDRLLQGLRGSASGSTFMRTNATLAGFLAGQSVGAFANYINTQPVAGRNGGLLTVGGFPENFVVVNPQFAAATLAGNFANSSYHSLQIDLSKRFGNGLSVQANYTWAKALGEEEGAGQEMLDSYRTWRNRAIEKRLLSFGAPHVYRGNWLYDLPVGPKRRFFAGTRGLLGRLLEHWQIGAIHNIFSGVPISWDSGRSSFNNFSGDNTATFTAPVSAHLGRIEKRGNGVFFYGGLQSVTDPSVASITNLNSVRDRSTLRAIADKDGRVIAVNPVAGTLGSSPLRYFYGPGYFVLDMNLLKTITIRERVQLQIGTTIDNVLNRAWFTDMDTFLSKNINNVNFGQITGTDNGPRIVILNARLNF
ncbi:MAG: carboxypeptidase-like regulatory domain-containing protein [Acidobacteriota bacterium]